MGRNNARAGYRELDLVDLVWYLGMIGVHHPEAVPLIDLCRRANEDRGYWLSAQGQWIPDTLSTLIYHESTTDAMTSYEPLMVPGILQTEDYARKMICRHNPRPAEVEAGVRHRLSRQEVLRSRNTKQECFIHEQARRLRVGTPAIMHEQLIALTLTSGMSNIVIRVVPSRAGGAGVLRRPVPRVRSSRARASGLPGPG